MANFHAEIVLAAPAEELFDFFIQPENAARLTPPEAGLKLCSAPEILEHGSRSELELSGFGPPQRLVYEVVELIRPRKFTENLVKGPLSLYRHEHVFEPTDKGTRVLDVVEFAPPGGMLGFLVSEDRIRTGLEQGMKFRDQELERIFGLA